MSPADRSPSIPLSPPATLVDLFRRRFSHTPSEIIPLRADGSSRSIYRLVSGENTAIGVHGPDPLENRAFLAFSRAFRSLELNVPEIYADDLSSGVYLEEDLGDMTLLRALEVDRVDESIPSHILVLYRRALADLIRFQIDGAVVVDFSLGFPSAEFGEREILWDLNYFKYHFLKLAGIPFSESKLEADFGRLVALLLSAPRDYFMYRDFQPRNIMIRDGEPWYIDYQGGRRGALQYDVASLLYSSKAALADNDRGSLLAYYLDELEARIPVDRERFLREFAGYRLIRMLQLFGAYGFRGLFERKAHFVESIPFAQENLRRLIASGGIPDNLPELRRVLEDVSDWRSAAQAAPLQESIGGLTVHVTSFSYRQGYPADATGHGGGFVFDCRALHNPGRYDEYKPLCGLDEPVRTFLQKEQSAGEFLDAVKRLVGPAVEAYRRRGFEHLSVAFGCTGGQHRSVYVADLFARWIAEQWPDVKVDVTHRESSRWPPGAQREVGEWTR